ncbi:uncharacterized protein (DUF58 family) [Saccharothrix variisporea]|uniref:Uncharacterized protein (DUF58 family) n=1 Tax=Saccharothrix variisporea TaxID=543527 RepID=A0A495XKP9_9PSEU|nr:uncharacterized protein (DUF58 family) [Saccharothrix variisporea]
MLLGYSMLVALSVGGVVVLALSGVTVVLRPGVDLVRRVVAERVTVGEPALGELVVRNTGRFAVPELLVVDRVGDQPVEVPVGRVRAGGRRQVPYRLPTHRRGRLVIGPFLVGRRDPLGLFHRAQPHGGTDVLWVHPRVFPANQVPVGTVPDYEGRAEAVKAGTTAFAALRDYVPGDDPRRIHWRSTARVGRLVVRDSVDTMEPTATVVLDTRSSVFDPDSFEHAVEVAASVAQATLDAGRSAGVDVRVVGEPVDPADSGVTEMLDRLAAAALIPDSDPLRLVEEVDQARPGAALVVVTGADDELVTAALAERRRRFAPIVVLRVVPAAHGPVATHRRRGLAVVGGHTARDVVSAWNLLVVGGVGR